MPSNTNTTVGKQSIAELSFSKSSANTKNTYDGTCGIDGCEKRIKHTFTTQERKPYRWFRCGRCQNVTLIVLDEIARE